MTKTTTSENAVATTTDDEELLRTTTVFRRHSKGPVMFNGCSPSGDVIILDNISTKKSYDLTGWYIERQTDAQPLLRYIFKNQFIIPPLTTIELWSNTAIPVPISNEFLEAQEQQQSFISIQIELSTWNSARQSSINRLFDSTGCEKAIFSHRTLTSTEIEQQ